jgi:hypothetical protein
MAEKKAAKKVAKKATSAKKATGPKKAASSAKKRAPSHAEIARRAYEIHEREGGHDEENWLRAERELRGG